MRFNIPQFVTIEDKILVGPVGITIRQLFLVFGAFLISYVSYKIFSGLIFLFNTLLSFGLAIILGWFKINNKYILNFLPKLIQKLFSSRRFIWKEEINVMNKVLKVNEIQKYIKLLEDEAIKFTKEKESQVENLPLAKLLQFAHKHGYNPKDPYINFPLPKFPKLK